MNKEDIKKHCIYRCIKHNTIEFVHLFCKYRKEDGTWVDGVIYQGLDRYTGKPTMFTTTIEDFCDRFEPIKE